MCHFIIEYLVPLLPYEFCSSYTLLVRQCCSLLQSRRPGGTTSKLVGTRNPPKCSLNNQAHQSNLKCCMPKNVSRLKGVFFRKSIWANFCKKLVGRQIPTVSIYYPPPGLHPTRRKSQCCTRQWLDNVDAQISSHTTLGNLPRKIDGASPQNICNCCYCRHLLFLSRASYIYTTLKVGP